MKNIISFSLYGNKQIYWEGALRNIKLAKEIYPNYVCRFYIDKQAGFELINIIPGDNVEIIFMNNQGGLGGTFWRFLGSVDDDVNIFLCRDADSIVSVREKLAVEEWLASDKDFHIMRDHPNHRKKIMGGMWGCRNKLMKKINFKSLIKNWKNKNKYGDDEKFLENKIYPLIKSFAFEHSEYNLRFYNPIHKFPKSEYEGFVGQRIL